MTNQVTTKSLGEALIDEVRRYLAMVEAFRVAGYEPRWRAENEGEDDE